MSRTIAEVSKDIADTNAIFSQEIEAAPRGQRAAVQMAIIQASERLPKLLDEMKEVIIPGKLIGLFATGDETSLVKVAEFLKENDGIVLDASELYRSITDVIEPSYSKERVFCTTQYGLMINKLSDIGHSLGYREIESPKYNERICPDAACTTAHVKLCLRECKVGDQANVDLLTKQAIDVIVRNKIDAKQIPVMVTGVTLADEKNTIATIFSRTIDYNFPKDFTPTVKNITALFKQQKQQDLEDTDEKETE